MRGYVDRNDGRQSSFPFRLKEKGPRGRVEPPRREPDGRHGLPEPDGRQGPLAPDVFDLVPPAADAIHLERCLKLDEQSSPLLKVMLWKPEDESDKAIRDLLVWFGQKVALSRPLRCVCCGKIHGPNETWEAKRDARNATPTGGTTGCLTCLGKPPGRGSSTGEGWRWNVQG